MGYSAYRWEELYLIYSRWSGFLRYSKYFQCTEEEKLLLQCDSFNDTSPISLSNDALIECYCKWYAVLKVVISQSVLLVLYIQLFVEMVICDWWTEKITWREDWKLVCIWDGVQLQGRAINGPKITTKLFVVTLDTHLPVSCELINYHIKINKYIYRFKK